MSEETFGILGELIGKPLLIRLDDGSTYAQMAGRVVSVDSDSGIPGVRMLTVRRDRDLDRRTHALIGAIEITDADRAYVRDQRLAEHDHLPEQP